MYANVCMYNIMYIFFIPLCHLSEMVLERGGGGDGLDDLLVPSNSVNLLKLIWGFYCLGPYRRLVMMTGDRSPTDTHFLCFLY